MKDDSQSLHAVLDLTSEDTRTAVWARLTQLTDGPQGARFGVGGRISTHQFVLIVARGRYTLPWRATFRGTVLSRPGGTLLTGKFDSDWAMIFLGYPVAFAIVANIVINVFAGRFAGRFGEFALFTVAAVGFCAILRRIDQTGRRSLGDALRFAVSGEHPVTG